MLPRTPSGPNQMTTIITSMVITACDEIRRVLNRFEEKFPFSAAIFRYPSSERACTQQMYTLRVQRVIFCIDLLKNNSFDNGA